MKRYAGMVAVLALVGLTGCDPRAISATMTTPERHVFSQDGVVCYTYSTTISCVKVKQ